MESSLKGLFGGGEEGAAKENRARDFAKRFSEQKAAGVSGDEVKTQLNDLLSHANADQVKRATRAALADLPEDQQKEFGNFVGQLKARKTGDASAAAGGFSMDDIADMFGQSGGSAGSLDDLLGGLLGGGGGGSTSSSGGGGGLGGMLSGMLGGLLGGDDKATTGAASQESGDFDLGGLLNSGVGKMVMGGIAAYLTKELLDGSN